MQIKLPYIRAYGDEKSSPYGLDEVVGVEAYNDIVCRDKVVFRIDMMYCLEDIFSTEIISKLRQLLYSIISGNLRDAEQVAEIFKSLYLNDVVFKKYLGEIIYFSEWKESGKSLYAYILRDILDKYKARSNRLLEDFGKLETKVLFESKMYLYLGHDDVKRAIPIFGGYREEKVSSAKVWKGDFQILQPE